MDIRNWPLDQIMQLPDWCFGNRWPIIQSDEKTDWEGPIYCLPAPTPEVMVVWELWFFARTQDASEPHAALWVRPFFSDGLLTTAMQAQAAETIFPLYDTCATMRGVLSADIHLTNLRQVVYPKGRRVGLDIGLTPLNLGKFSFGLVVSGIPREVPDWLISR